MKKLEEINFSQCDELSQNQMSMLHGGDGRSTHQDICNEATDICGEDWSYVITWDDGSLSCGLICPDILDPE